MPEHDDLERRLRAVERTLTDGDHDVDVLQDASAMADRLDAIETRIDDLEEQAAELDAATQAVRGYVGNVRAVNEEVESRADAALAAVDRIEARLESRAGEGGRPASAATAERRPGNGRRNGEKQGAPASAGTVENGYGIEMPPPRERSDAADSDDEERTTVIDRVREAL